HFADLPRWNFALAQRQHLLHDPVDRCVNVFSGHRPLVQRALEADANALDVEVGAIAVRLHDLRQAQLGGLVGREALLALRAAAAAANRIAWLGYARIDDLRVVATAKRTFHASGAGPPQAAGCAPFGGSER